MIELLLPYQKDWIADEARVKAYEKSRRIGISWAEACDCVTIAADEERGSNVYYMSYNKDMTRQFIEDCADWARDLNQAASALQAFMLKDGERDIQVYQINFASGHHIQALSGSPRNLRSKQGVLVIDEAAFLDDIRAVIKAGMAFLIWGGKVRIISTHNGEENPFNELVQDIRKGKKSFSLHRTTLDDALADGLYRRICKKLGREWTAAGEAQWRQELIEEYRDDYEEELFCIPSKSGGRYIPRAVIEAAMSPEIPVVRWECRDGFTLQPAAVREAEALAFCEEELLPHLESLPRLPSFLGEDFGRTGDLTDLWPAQRLPNLDLHTPFVTELRNVPYEQQRQILFYLLDRLPRFSHAALDARGNGEYLAEVALQRYGAARVSAVKITQGWYLTTMPKLKAALEDRKLDAPKHDDVLDDLRAITVVNGIPQIPDTRTTEKGADGAGRKAKKRHGDAAVAAAMLIHAAEQGEAVEFDYEAVKTRASGFAELQGAW